MKDLSHAYCQISVKYAKPFQRRQFFPYQPIRNNNRPWQPCLLTDRDEMRKFYKGPDIDASCQISVHLAKRFQRKKFSTSANQKQESPMAAMFVDGSGRNEQSL